MTLSNDDLADIRAIGDSVRKEMLEANDEANHQEEQQIQDDNEVIDAEPVEEVPVVPQPVVFMDDDDEDESFIVSNTPEEVESATAPNVANTQVPPSLSDMVEAYGKIPSLEVRKTMAKALHGELDEYQKKLIISDGFTPEEAAEAAWSRMGKLSKERTQEYLEDNPTEVTLTINKDQEAELKLTPEERDKMIKSSALRVIVVEEKELATLETVSLPSREKTSFLDSVLGNLSKYGLPMPNYGDFISFKGAKSVQLASVIETQDMTPAEMINQYASMIYDRMIGGTVLKKTDEMGNMIMNYEEFCNNFPYYDMDMAMYAILCASAEEELTIPLQCNSCNAITDVDVKVKTTLNLSDDYITEHYKERIDHILKSRADVEEMLSLVSTWNKAYRIRSLSNNNVYTIQMPSISKAIATARYVTDLGNVEQSYLSLLQWVREIRIWNEEKHGYVLLTDEGAEGRLLCKFVCEMPEKDLVEIGKFIVDKVFAPTFTTKMTCSKCMRENEVTLNLINMVFRQVLAMQDLTLM